MKVFQLSGLIPACAGKTLWAIPKTLTLQAHPRVCGENSPGRLSDVKADWLIPACAGKTKEEGGLAGEAPAHPRVCGENPQPRHPSPWAQGSSPRVRGKPGRFAHPPR